MNIRLYAIAANIDALPPPGQGFTDNASCHEAADKLVIEALRAAGADEVADAYERLRERVTFWYE